MINVHSVAGEGILVAPMTTLRIYIDRNDANQMTTGSWCRNCNNDGNYV